jgi:hypothetical protein
MRDLDELGFDDPYELPNLDHWKSVMEFTAEQAALLLAMIDPLEATLEGARRHKLPRWKQAHGHALGIVSAIRQGLIAPVVCKGHVWKEVETYNDLSMERVLQSVRASDREAEISLTDTIITRASLIGWVTSENVQITRRPKSTSVQRPAPLQVTTPPPIIIEAESEPLALTHHGHTSEGLEFVDEAIRQFWSTHDEGDPGTVPRKEEIIEFLKSKGATGNMAEAVDKILRPKSTHKAHLKNHKVPTRSEP